MNQSLRAYQLGFDSSDTRDASIVRRRLFTIPAYFFLFGLMLAGAPVWIPMAVITDLLRGKPSAALRCGLFLAYYLACECWGVIGFFGIWVFHGRNRERFESRSDRLSAIWGSSLLWGAKTFFGFGIEITGEEALSQPGFLLFLRHASVADTLIGPAIVARPHDVRFRYVVKRDLLMDPCLDIVGNRLPNYFAHRNAKHSERDIAGITGLIEAIPPDQSVLIYPEGTRFTDAKKQQILERLKQKGESETLALAKRLRHTLPPRLGGPLALLQNNPGMDVVVCAHTGFEGTGSFWELWNGKMVNTTVQIAFWRIPYADIPKTREAQVDWLFRVWESIDDWIDQHRQVENGA